MLLSRANFGSSDLTMPQAGQQRARERRSMSYAEWKPALLKRAAASRALSAVLRSNLSASVLGTQARLDTVLEYAYHYASGASLPWIAAAIRSGRELHRRIASVAAEMKAIGAAAGALEDWQAWFVQVPEQVKVTAETLAREWGGIAEYGQQRLSAAEMEREFLLALFLHYVKTVTGEPHYKELAVVLREGASLLGTNHGPPEKKLRELYEGYAEQYPLVLDACLALW